MKLFNTQSELRALKTICDGDQKYSGRLLALLSDDHFYYEPAKAAIHRVRVLVKSTGNLPSYSDLCADPTIDEDYRKLLVKAKETPIKSSSLMNGLVDTLNKYHKLRSLYFMSESMFNKLQKEKVDIDGALEDVTNTITQLRVKSDISQSIYHTGINNNSTSLVKNLLSKTKPNYVPTGFNAFDSRNGGIMYGSLFVLGGSTGGGKSMLSLNLLKNMSLNGEDVAYVPLEMTSEESMARLISNLGQIPLIKIIKKQLTDNERKKIISSYKQYIDKLKKLECRYTIFSPEEDMTAEDILMILKPYGYRVVIIDYIGLLKGVDGDDSWQQLGKVARFCKIWAKNNNMIVVLLAQVSEEGKIRYARSIAEHCVTGDTLIDTDKGLIRIDSLYPDAKIMSTRKVDIKVKSDGGYLPISGVHYNGIRQVYKITLEDGHTLKCTSNHRIRTLNADGSISWNSISKSLKVGSWVAVDKSKSSFSRKVPVYEVPTISIHHNAKPLEVSKLKVNEDFAYLLGLLSSDGYLGKHGVQFVASDKAIMNAYDKAWVKTFGKNSRKLGTYTTPNGINIWRSFCTSEEVCRLLKSIEGMQGHAEGKYMPDIILNAPKNVVCRYISGVFDGDGTTTKFNVRFSSISTEQLKRIQLALQKLGISGSINFQHRYLNVGGEYASKFKKLIKLTKAKRTKLDPESTLRDYIPEDFILQIYKDANCKSLRLKSRTKYAKSILTKLKKELGLRVDMGAYNFSYSELPKLVKCLSGTYYEKLFTDILKSKDSARFSRILSIEKLGEEKVYDLTVPETHNYVANGITVHNSNNAWIFVATEETRESGLLDIKQIKSRNQEMFPFQLSVDASTMTIKDVDSSEQTDSDTEEQDYLDDVSEDESD